ncbi:type II secretion system GspH family protein [Verrucomicrobiales bacterium]|nr:type II secretion system GspH family protein [Verrucomicrobiales bacterium]
MKTRIKAAKGYTLVEVLVGMAILSIAIGTATSLASTSSEVEARNREVGRVHSIIEAAHNLYQLGISPANIPALLPFDPLVTVSFGSSNLQSSSFPSAAPFEAVSITGTFQIAEGDGVRPAESTAITIESIRENPAFR